MDKKNKNFEIEWTEAKISRLWDYYSNNLPENQYFSYHSSDYILKDLIKVINIKQKIILDYGCGPGFLIEKLLNNSNDSLIYGLDSSSESLKIVKDKFTSNPNFGGAYDFDGLSTAIDAESIDLITCIEIIEHLNDDQIKAALTLIHKLLKHHGSLVITMPNQEDLDINKTMCPECGCIFHRWQHVRSWKPKDIEEWLNRTGFTPIIIQPTHFQSSKSELIEKIRRAYKLLTNQKYERIYPHLLVIAKKI